MNKQEPIPKEVQDAVNNLDAAAENRMGPQTTREDYRQVVAYIYGLRAEQEVREAFYSLTVKERDYERGRYDRLKDQYEALRAEARELTARLSAYVKQPVPIRVDASKVDLTRLNVDMTSALERDMATLNDRLQKVIYQLELRLPGQARFVDIATATFASELLALIRGTS